jgi:hypothetical protein
MPTVDLSASIPLRDPEWPFPMILIYCLGFYRMGLRAVTLVAVSTKVVPEVQHARVRKDQQGKMDDVLVSFYAMCDRGATYVGFLDRTYGFGLHLRLAKASRPDQTAFT